jgi:hypothetical protein
MRRALTGLLFFVSSTLFADGVPPYAALPAGFVSDPGREVMETFGREEFPPPGDVPPVMVEGRHYAASYRGDPPLELDGETTWARKLRPAFLSRGWKISRDEAGTKVLRLQSGGHDAWLKLDLFGSDDIRVALIEIVPQPVKLTLPPPAAQAEHVAENADFPFLGHYPGSQFRSANRVDAPLDITTDTDSEPQLAGTGYVSKSYTVPERTSVHQVLAVYRDALKMGGWNIVKLSEPSDGVLLVHYMKSGRDIWASMHVTGEEIVWNVADTGSAADLARQLDRLCHVAMYGIHFDFNKATLRPDSEAALQQIVGLLQANPSLGVEVQGHTDNVGGDASNQKLSEARAASVQAWLTQHGIAASRLTAHGYGKTHPVASNDDDEGRAKNRRVEIAKANCK